MLQVRCDRFYLSPAFVAMPLLYYWINKVVQGVSGNERFGSGGFNGLASLLSQTPTASSPICWEQSVCQLCLGFLFCFQEDKAANSDKVRNPNNLMRTRK